MDKLFNENGLRFFLWLILPIVAIIVFWVLWYNTLVNDGFYFYFYLFFITFLFILFVSSLWALLRVPSIAQIKGYNVYAWLGIAWVLGIISYFILKGLEDRRKNETQDNNTAKQNSVPQNPSVIPNRVAADNSRRKVLYSAWICPKCGEKNSYAAKNCINCFEPKP